MTAYKLGGRIAAEALALVGVPFRLQGRSVEAGLDCVGLAALAAERAGHVGFVPAHYGLRGGDPVQFVRWLEAAGLHIVDRAEPGDFVLVRAGPVQFHLMVRVHGGFVHAHAGLRRVVEMPGETPWPVIGVWRVQGVQIVTPIPEREGPGVGASGASPWS